MQKFFSKKICLFVYNFSQKAIHVVYNNSFWYTKGICISIHTHPRIYVYLYLSIYIYI